MPEFDFSGDVFTLDAGAGFDEGIVRGDVGAGSRLAFETRFELCHGLAAEASAEAVAQAAADLGLLWVIAGRAEGEALAAAGVQLDAQATIDLFDRVGLSAEFAAFAEAALAGRLSVGLDLQEIALAARDALPGPAFEAFLAFLREVRVEAGVWGKIAFAAMVKARLNVRGSLADDANAGFAVEYGVEAGLAAGGGYDFYAGIRLENPKRFFLNAADIVSGEIVREARAVAPRSLHPHVAALEYVLPATLASAYELGQLAAEQLLDGSRTGGVVADCLLAELQRFALDKIGLAGATLVGRALDHVATWIGGAALAAAERDALAATVRTLIETLRGQPLAFTSIHAAVPALAEVLEGAVPEDRERWRPLLAVTWLAFAAADSVRRGVVSAHAEASAGLIGLGAQAAAAFRVSLPQPPAIVREELEALLGAVPEELELGAVVDYLVETQVVPLLEQTVPDLYPVLELVSREMGIEASDLVELVLRAAAGQDLTQAELYQALRAAVGTMLDDLILETLLPSLESVLGEGTQARVWLDEVARPSLTMMRDFALVRVDDLVAGGAADSPFTDRFRTGLSLMIGKIVLSNVVVLVDVLLAHVTASVSGASAELSAAVRGEPGDEVAIAAEELAETLLPPFLPVPANLPDASRELAAELLLALSEATSEEILTPERRSTTRELMRRILFSVYGEADAAGPEPDDVLAEVAACAYLPAPDALSDLFGQQAAIAAEQLAVALPRSARAIERFFGAVATGTLQELEEGMARGLRELRDQIVALGREIVLIGRQIEALGRELERLADEIAAHLDAAAAALRDPRRRGEILSALELDGIAKAEENARAVPGFEHLPAAQQQDAVAFAVGTFVFLFGLVRPLLDSALRVLAEIADQLSDLFEGAADLAGLLADLAGEVTDRVEEAVNDLAGLDLPDEIGVEDVARIAAEIATELPLIGDALAAAFGDRRTRAEKQALRGRVEADRETKREQQQRARLARERAVGERPAIVTICSPQPLADELEEAFAYGSTVPVEITIVNVPPPSLSDAGAAPKPILLALNGAPIRLPPFAWKRAFGLPKVTLSHTLTPRNSALRPGVNVLECSYADSVHPTVRKRVVFLAHAAPPSDEVDADIRDGGITVTGGRLPTRLDGWRLQHSRGGVAPLSGTLAEQARLPLPDTAFSRPRRRKRPRLDRPPAAGAPPTDGCPPVVAVIDKLGRWRAEARLPLQGDRAPASVPDDEASPA